MHDLKNDPSWATTQRLATRVVPAQQLNALMQVSTLILLFACVLATFVSLGAVDADQVFGKSASIVAAGLGLAVWIEARAGLRNLMRVDLFMLAALFMLTFFEFLLPQNSINFLVSKESAQTAVRATLLTFAGIVIGRHAFPVQVDLPERVLFQISPRATMTLLIGSALLGYLYMLIAVEFDIFEMLYQMTLPRFSQPWARGRLGSFATLLNEFALLSYLIPPLAASILVHARQYGLWEKSITIALLALVFFESLAGGTRSVFLTHLITFSVAFTFLSPRLNFSKLVLVFVPFLLVSYLAIFYLPEIRTVGLSNFDIKESQTENLFVDMNLINIAIISEVVPETVSYLGFEVAWIALIRPIPRALWPGKPEGLSFSVNDAVGVGDYMTIAAAFPGELWMSGGYLAILIASVLVGAGAARWNAVGARARTDMEFAMYVLALLPAGLMMRSLMSSAPAFLPILAVYLFLRFTDAKHSGR